MKECKKCNKFFEDTEGFCTACGSALEQCKVIKECKNCNRIYENDEVFCSGCGGRLQTVEHGTGTAFENSLGGFGAETESGFEGEFAEDASLQDFAIALEPGDLAEENNTYVENKYESFAIALEPEDKPFITFAEAQRYKSPITTRYYHLVKLKNDGTVVAVGENDHGQCNVQDWKDIVAVSAGNYHTVGLKKDGTVVAVGSNHDGQCDIKNWKDIVAVSAGYDHTVGLRKDGTVVAVGNNDRGQCNVQDWKDIVAVSAGNYHTVGLKKDGTVVAVGSNHEYEAHIDEKSYSDLLSYKIVADKCKGCTLCSLKCPADAILGAVKTAHTIDTDKCIKCGTCHKACKFNAIIIE